MRCPCLILAAALWLGGPVAVADAPAPAPEAASGWTPKTAVQAREFMVAAAHPLAVETGRDVIRRGGSAADAAIAMQLVLGLVEPQSSGLGGGAFVLYWDAAAGQVKSLDGREAWNPQGLPQRAIQAVKKAVPQMGVMTERNVSCESA